MTQHLCGCGTAIYWDESVSHPQAHTTINEIIPKFGKKNPLYEQNLEIDISDLGSYSNSNYSIHNFIITVIGS